MADVNKVVFYVELSEIQALAFAQFLKRVSHSDYRSNAIDEDETYLMKEAGYLIQDALADVGFSPR